MHQKQGSIDRRAMLGGIATALAVSASAKSNELPSEVSEDSGSILLANSPYKKRAIADYQRNMQPFGGSLSSTVPPDLAVDADGSTHYDIIVVGSGYGSAITAARLAQQMRPGVKLAVLERGAEWIAGTFPDRLGGLTDQARLRPIGKERREINNPIGLYDFRQTDELRILGASALGGCSLINANVAIKPDRDVFLQSQWPIALQDREVLEPYYERAGWELNVHSESIDHSKKMRAQRIAAQRLADIGCHFEAAALTISRGIDNSLPIVNRQGLWQRSCINCGDCMTGCNVGAKNTLAMNYLPLARRCGAYLFTQCEVRRIHRQPDHYCIEYLHHERDLNGSIRTTSRMVSTRMIVIGAGSIGSSEILLRSQCDSFRFSPALGCHWSSNGDALGFVDKSDLCPTSGGIGTRHRGPGPGPTIQSNLSYPNRISLHDRVLIQDGAVASVYLKIVKAYFLDIRFQNTMPLLGMGHDGQHGRIVILEDGNADILWPGMRKSAYRQMIKREFELVAQAHGGKFRELHPPRERAITVHPLGGCAMSDDPHQGVVNHRGQVFDFSSTGLSSENGRLSTYPGLYVCDGSIFPTAIAANPFFTISAIAERNAALLIADPQNQHLFRHSVN